MFVYDVAEKPIVTRLQYKIRDSSISGEMYEA